ncbi:MAG: hypothetical protein R6W76_00505 [Caldilinea sp.]
MPQNARLARPLEAFDSFVDEDVARDIVAGVGFLYPDHRTLEILAGKGDRLKGLSGRAR